jgi:hypothetical protein
MGGTLIHTGRQYYFASLLPEAQRPRWFYERSMLDAMRAQSGAFPELVQMANDNTATYMREQMDSDAALLTPIAIEEEFCATLGELDPGGPDSSLDNEIVSCRTDLVYKNEGGLWILDYKSLGYGGINKKTGELLRWKEDNEFALNWQVLVNLHILRKRLGPVVRGFVIERTTRQPPYRHDRHVLSVPQMAYENAPRVARACVQREHEVTEQVRRGIVPLQSPWACTGRYGHCDYRDVCMADSKKEMLSILNDRSRFWQPPPEELARMQASLTR